MNVVDIVPSLYGKEKSYIDEIQLKYNVFKTESEIQPLFIGYKFQEQKLSRKISTLYHNIYDIVHNRYSYIFVVTDYMDIDKLANCLIDHYFKLCIENHCTLDTMLLIDVGLLLQDIKANNYSNTMNTLALNYSLTTILNNVKTAPSVLWYNLESIKTEYETNKMLEIFSYRHKRILGNLYFVKKGVETWENLSLELHNELDPDAIVDLQAETYEFESLIDRKQDIIW